MVLKKLIAGFSKWELLLFVALLIFSGVLMFSTFKISPEGNMEIATKVWSDFAATIPLIRSFSFGSNFPPEYPIFAGPPIRYHFLFYMFVGFLEKAGLSLALALNLLSSIGFFLLSISIYLFARTIFRSKKTALLSVIMFLFNGSLAFLEFFKINPLSQNTIYEVVKNDTFSSFGPYDGKIISAFWSLNIFTNQRHLAISYAVFITIMFLIHYFSKEPKKFKYIFVIMLGIFVGFFPFFHFAVFGMIGITLMIQFLIYPKIRLKIFIVAVIALLLAIPQILYMGSSTMTTELLKFGYLIQHLTLESFLNYWFLNLGLVGILGLIGFIISDKEQKKIFLPFMTLFVVGNIFQLSPEIAANHKFFNLFVIGLNMFASYSLIKVWNKNTLGKAVVTFLFPLTILSGVIDFFPIMNDRFVTIPDIPNNQTADFIKKSTAKDSVFLNSSYLYDPASLAGRKIFLGWPYFSWSAGYNTDSRFQIMKIILESDDKTFICNNLRDNNISHVSIQEPTHIEGVIINYDFYESNFKEVFFDPSRGITIYEVSSSCRNI